MTSLSLDYWGEQLSNAKHGQKGSILKQACDTLGLSKDALYRRLKANGWTSGKAQRVDAGTTSMDEEAINMMVAILNQGVRDNGKRIMDITTAKSILVVNGYKCLSTSQISRVLSTRNAAVSALDRATPHIQMRSLAPNHVHQVDPSYCLLYYPPGRKGKIQRYANDSEFYANKPENIERIKHLRVWRYVLIDHNSGALRVKYYESAGETQAIMFDFLMWCWRQHQGSPFMGVPQILLWDKGSANTAKAITNVLTALKVKNIPHEAGNPRAKGAVEVANNIVEKQFESRILFEPVGSVAELNESVWAWQEAFNADKVPGMNCKHSRHKKARFDVWLNIYKPENRDYLRMLPDEQVCRLLLTRTDEDRKVQGDLTISYVHPRTKSKLVYDLA
ncbi:DDE-type integrase/transposase/recombinase, partial [Pseudoalteromonas sp. S16_S37]|uniref:DDE-type integrase/transposase/recombinase n=1 Tax=Pseudoalteromonas sp. S16_S37 TaxID=2720228 RepID=UPI001680D98A